MKRLQTAFFNSTRGFSINNRTDQTVYSIDFRQTKAQCNLWLFGCALFQQVPRSTTKV